jgi:hypothetical protein
VSDRQEQLPPIDAVLGEGTPEQYAAFADRLGRDPALAIEVAETRQLVEHLRGLRTAPGPRFAHAMDSVVRRAERHRDLRSPEPGALGQTLALLGAAAAAFLLLALVDPLRLRRLPGLSPDDVALPAATGAAAVPGPSTGPAEDGWAAAGLLPPGSKLRTAAERSSGRSPGERLADWLSPLNQVALLRLDYELRASAEARRQALRDRGSLPDVDERVRRLAADVAAALAADEAMPERDAALAVRALLASGRYDRDALPLVRGADRLAAALPGLHGGELATVLAALGELAASTGAHLALVQEHGLRLLRETIGVDEETWTRRRPRLLSAATPAAQVADAGRFLALGPGFGLPAEEVLLARMLLSAHLQERRDPRTETPDLLTALVYGFGDLLDEGERHEVEERLRIWRPTSLVPDYVALQQLAWSRTPWQPGFARFQLELRRISALPTPESIGDRAALCMCLATNFAAPGALAEHPLSD